MKRLLPVLLGALAGAIGLPVVMRGSSLFFDLVISPKIFPTVATIILVAPKSPWFFLTSTKRSLIFGALLGAWSAILWCGKRTFAPRIASAVCALGIGAFFVWMLAQDYKSLGTPNVTTHKAFLSEFAFYFPLILWSLALLFFAVLARKRKPLLS